MGDKSRLQQEGFSLVEMVISVAILAILAAVAIPAYQDYIATTNVSKVLGNWGEAKNLTKSTFTKGHVQTALNHTVSVPASDSDWMAVYNSNGGLAPGGGLAYVAGSGISATGQIGVTYSGSFPMTAQVILDLPAYESITAQTVTIVAADLK